MMKKNIFMGLLFSILFSSTHLLNAQTFNLDVDPVSRYYVTDYLFLYEDSSNKLSFEDILKTSEDKFIKNSSRYPAFGFTQSAFWGKFTWHGKGHENRWYLVFNYTMLDKIDLYIPDPVTGKYLLKPGGNIIPISKKEVRHRKTIFILEPPADGKEQTIYFRVNSNDTIELPMELLNQDALRDMDYTISFVQGVYYGIVLVMLIYNFFLFLSIRDPAYIYYVGYIFCYGVVQYGLDGYLYQYFFPNHHEFAQITRMVSANIALSLALRFADSFFNIKDNFPKLKHLVTVFYLLTFINTIIVVLNFFVGAQIVFILLFLSVVLFMYFSLNLFNKYPPVRLYFFAWFIFIIATFLWSLKLFHIYIPVITQYAMQAGSAIEVTLLSFALGSRIGLINREKEEIRIEALRQKQLTELGLAQLAAMRLKSSALESELTTAREIQFAMIPLISPFPNIKSVYLPMEKIGGDFYDIIKIDDNRIGIFISDVSGHGIPAALITMMLKSMILFGVSESYREKESSWLMEPDKFISHVNNSLHGHLRDYFTTAFYGVYDKKDRSFTYSSAAHPPPILLEYLPGNQLNFSFLNVSPQAPPLGVFIHEKTEKAITVHRIILPENSRLFLYSDGLMDNADYGFIDSHNGLESFKHTFLYDVFKDSGADNLQTFLENITSQLLLKRDSRLEDDVCIVVLEV